MLRIGGRTWIGAGLAIDLLFAAAAVATAGQEDAVLTPAARGGTQVLTAAELAAWGRGRSDAGPLITSAFADLDGHRAGDAGGRARALQAGIRAVRAERRWAHPAYWAAFTLVGEPG